jgi:hypothetical protein
MRAASALVVMLSIGGVVAWQWPSIMLLYRWARTPSVVEAPNETPPTTGPKFADRLDPGGPQPNAGSTTVTPAGAAVAQRAVLYEEDPADPQGKRFVGSAIWRTETIAGTGVPARACVRADLKSPAQAMTGRRAATPTRARRRAIPSRPRSSCRPTSRRSVTSSPAS